MGSRAEIHRRVHPCSADIGHRGVPPPEHGAPGCGGPHAPLGSAYAVWTGIGTLGTVMLGIVLFGEPTTIPRLICVGLILVGILGLKLTSAS